MTLLGVQGSGRYGTAGLGTRGSGDVSDAAGHTGVREV